MTVSVFTAFSSAYSFSVSAEGPFFVNEDNSLPVPVVRTTEELHPLSAYQNNTEETQAVQSSMLRSQAVAPPTNDACGSATLLTVNAACLNGTTDQGTVQTGEVLQPSCAQTAFTQTVWYSFVATSTTMFVQLNTTGTFYGSGATWYPNNWASAVYSAGGCPPAATRLINCQYHSSVGTSDGIIVNTLSGLSIGSTYLIQVGYAQPSGGGPSGVVPQFCIKVGDRFTPVCNRCTSACGPACGFTVAPTVAQVTSGCPSYDQTPFLEGSVADTQCYTFIARNTTVSFNVILNSTCGTGNVANFSWTLYGPNGCTTVQSGNLSNLTFTNLVPLQTYTYCYSFSVPASCYHTAYWPYFVGASPLPVELTSFTAFTQDSKVKLEWTTASEINNDFFAVERSRDGIEFETIHSQKGAANSSETLNYSYIDRDPFPGTSYYRLKQTDFDGAVSYSEVVAVKLKADDTHFQLYPNPAQGLVSVFFASPLNAASTVKVHDLSGREVLSRQLEEDVHASGTDLDVSHLLTGIYFVTVQTPTSIATQRLVLK